MSYFIPELALGVLLPKETELAEKFGGLPWGLPMEKWPLCKSCGKPSSHLFTLKHDPKRLNLLKDGRILMAFMCDHEPGCDTWEMDGGANAILILDEGDLETGLTDAPGDGAKTETEAFIVAWKRHDEPDLHGADVAFFDSHEYTALMDDVLESVYQSTQLGGLPYWVQSPEGPRVPPFRFAGQFDSSFVFHGPPPRADQAVCPVYRYDAVTKERHEEKPPEGWVPPPGGPSAIHVSNANTYRCEGPNYGGDGMAYLFLSPLAYPTMYDLDPSVEPMPSGTFFWQCT